MVVTIHRYGTEVHVYTAVGPASVSWFARHAEVVDGFETSPLVAEDTIRVVAAPNFLTIRTAGSKAVFSYYGSDYSLEERP